MSTLSPPHDCPRPARDAASRARRLLVEALPSWLSIPCCSGLRDWGRLTFPLLDILRQGAGFSPTGSKPAPFAFTTRAVRDSWLVKALKHSLALY